MNFFVDFSPRGLTLIISWLIPLTSFMGWIALSTPYAQTVLGDSIEVHDPAQDHLRLGIDFFLTGELEVAIDEFREATRLRTGYADAYHNLGVALAKNGDLSGAIAAWSQAQRLDPSGEPIRYHLSALVSYNYGVSLVREGKLKLAMAEWQKALNIQPDLSEAHYALGFGYLSLGNAQQAAVDFSHALSWNPDWPEAHYQLGVAYYEIREFDLAEQAWRTTLNLRPDFANAYSNLGLIQFLKGDLAEAIESEHQAIALEPELASAHFNLSLALIMKGDLESALDSLQTVIRIQPGFSQARMLQGVLWSRLGQWGRAVSEWRQALQTFPTPSESAFLHFNLGLALSLLGDPQGAIPEFKQTLAYRPQWAEAHYHLGVARESIKDWTGAMIAFERTIALKPSWAHAYFNLGKVYSQLGTVSKAIEAYRQAVRLEPNFSDAHYQLGVALRAQNRPAEAIGPLKAAAEGGMVEAQTLLGSMYANGSGVTRDLPQAMVWWFRAASHVSAPEASVEARDRLSYLRRRMFRGDGSSTDIEEIEKGFRLIRQTFEQPVEAEPSLNGHLSEIRTRNQSFPINQGKNAVPVLIQEALALDETAQKELEPLYLQGIEGTLNPEDPDILEYFIQTAQENNHRSCRFLEDLVRRQIVENSGSVQTALETCY
jgi:tetratricopeptide (TPR) repeat protein